MDLNSLTCAATLEEQNTKGETLRKINNRNVTFSLGRNEFRDVILCVSFPNRKEFKYVLRNLFIHKKFVRDGKATIKVTSSNVQIMLSNCAPDKLIMFLKTMSTKLECLKKKGFVTDRVKMLSDLPKTFEEISPLTIKDLKEAQEKKAKEAEKDLCTPKGKALKKRKRTDDDGKENLDIQVKLSTSGVLAGKKGKFVVFFFGKVCA